MGGWKIGLIAHAGKVASYRCCVFFRNNAFCPQSICLQEIPMPCLPSGFQFALRGKYEELFERLRSAPEFDRSRIESFYPYIEVLFIAPISEEGAPLASLRLPSGEILSFQYSSEHYSRSRLVAESCGEPLPENVAVYESEYTLETISELYAQWSHEDHEAFDEFLQSDDLRNYCAELPQRAEKLEKEYEVSRKAERNWKRSIDTWFRYTRRHKFSARQRYLMRCVRSFAARCKGKPMQRVVPPFYENLYLRLWRNMGGGWVYYASFQDLKGLVAERKKWEKFRDDEQAES
jgi:hypothetical protein